MQRDPRIPVIVITGFLGSGKTTLLREVLNTPELSGSMLIVNEVGEIAVDHHLLERSDDDTVLLGNGCMCCQLRGDLQTLLVDLSMRRARGEIPSFERVFIETSGMAEPGPIAQTLYGDGPLAREYRLAHVVALVDPTRPEGREAAPDVAAAQLALADLIVLSKGDLATDSQRDAARAWAQDINALAPVTETRHGRLDIALLADASTFSVLNDDAVRAAAQQGGLFGGTPSSGAGYLGAAAKPHRRLPSFVLHFAQPPARATFDLFLDVLLRLRGADLLRTKGFVRFAEDSRPMLIQGVCHVFDQPVPLRSQRADGEAPPSCLVFITRTRLDEPVRALWDAIRTLAGPAS